MLGTTGATVLGLLSCFLRLWIIAVFDVASRANVNAITLEVRTFCGDHCSDHRSSAACNIFPNTAVTAQDLVEAVSSFDV